MGGRRWAERERETLEAGEGGRRRSGEVRKRAERRGGEMKRKDVVPYIFGMQEKQLPLSRAKDWREREEKVARTESTDRKKTRGKT